MTTTTAMAIRKLFPVGGFWAEWDAARIGAAAVIFDTPEHIFMSDVEVRRLYVKTLILIRTKVLWSWTIGSLVRPSRTKGGGHA